MSAGSGEGELPPDQPQPWGGGGLHAGHQPLARSECGEESSRAAILTEVLRPEMSALVMQKTKECNCILTWRITFIHKFYPSPRLMRLKNADTDHIALLSSMLWLQSISILQPDRHLPLTLSLPSSFPFSILINNVFGSMEILKPFRGEILDIGHLDCKNDIIECRHNWCCQPHIPIF